MHARFIHLFALVLALPVASCRFVGGKPDFGVWQDAMSPVENDTVYVEKKPEGFERVADYRPATPAATPRPAAPASPPPATAATRYTVRPGDTLSRIARLHNVPMASLAAANGIDPQQALIKSGQQLIIPAGATSSRSSGRGFWTQLQPPPPTPYPTSATSARRSSSPWSQVQSRSRASQNNPTRVAGTRYRVQPGDTLLRIARSHGVTLQALLQANNLKRENADSVHAGSILIIPTQPRS